MAESSVHKLLALAHVFGPGAARRKERRLAEIAAAPRLTVREQRLLQPLLGFLRAYPDSPKVLDLAERVVSCLPRAESVYSYSYGVVRRLVRLAPQPAGTGLPQRSAEIEWDDLEDDTPLQETLDETLVAGERQALEDIRLSLADWFAATRPAGMTDLEFVVRLVENTPLPESVQVSLYERSDLPVRYRGPSPASLTWPQRRIHYQRSAIERQRFPLPPRIRRPLGPPSRGGQRLIDLSLQALCPRQLEIFPLIHANPADTSVSDCGRGVQVGLIGVRPEWRSPLESVCFFLVLKNGVPAAYGPAGVFLGCCELGINLFPEFRGGEIRFLYAQVMRVLHHRLGADYFFMTRYGLGENNPEAIRSGAFWFYRKLGFRPTNPAVEALALEEESRMAADPGHRSDARMLRRLSPTEVYLDLSRGRCRPFDFGGLGLAASRFIAGRFGGDRQQAEKRCAARIGRLLQVSPAARAVRHLAPLLGLIPDLGRWSRGDKAALGRILRAKDAPSEVRAAHLLKAHSRLEAALRQAASRRD